MFIRIVHETLVHLLSLTSRVLVLKKFLPLCYRENVQESRRVFRWLYSSYKSMPISRFYWQKNFQTTCNSQALNKTVYHVNPGIWVTCISRSHTEISQSLLYLPQIHQLGRPKTLTVPASRSCFS